MEIIHVVIGGAQTQLVLREGTQLSVLQLDLAETEVLMNVLRLALNKMTNKEFPMPADLDVRWPMTLDVR